MNKILVIRHDKIGDFVLSWPAFFLLKSAFPDASIEVLVSPVVKDFALDCPYIDHAFVDDGNDKSLSEYIARQHYDAVLVFHSEKRMCKIVRDAKVPYALAPKLGWWQFFYPDRASIKYKKGEPCWRGNCLLVEHFLTKQDKAIPEQPQEYWNIREEREKWRSYYHCENNEKMIFLHAGSGGSSASLSVEQFNGLLTNFKRLSALPFKVMLTYSGSEETLAKALLSLLQENNIRAALAQPLSSLAEFSRSLVAADLFIAGSTGPIHIAGLHNVPTVGFYARRKSQPHIRWQTLSQANRKLAITPPPSKKSGRDMSQVNIEQAAKDMAAFMDKIYVTDV